MDLIKILFQKAQTLDSFDKLDEVISIVGKNAKHNLTKSEIKSLAKMYLSDSVEMKKSQLEGKDDMLENIYYYNPSIKSIQKYSNILRSDLGLSKITDKDDFLNERVIDHYGSLVPLTKLDDSLLRKAQNDTTNKKHKKDNSNDANQQSDSSNDQSQSNDMDAQQSDMNAQQPNDTVNNQNNQQQPQQGQEIDTTAY